MLGLQGIRILSFNHFLMGPVGVQSLADCGADVIAVEPLEGAFQRRWGGVDSRQVGGQTMLQLTGNRNKRSLALNIKDARAIEIIMALLPTIDVITENFRPGVMDKLGLGYEALKAIKPDIIYAAGSGFGQDGPYVNRPGQDLIIQAISGLAAITGTREGGPRAVGVSAVDHHGALLYANGILTALLHRERTGQGCRVDVNLLSAALDLQQESLVCFLNGNHDADVRQTGHVSGWYFSAPYGIYPTADGSIALSLSPLALFYRILEVPADEQIPAQRAFDEQGAVAQLIARRLVLQPTAHWRPIFDQHQIWYSPVNDYRALLDDPQVKHLQSFTTIPGASGAPIMLVNHPIRYNGAAPQVRTPPPLLGAQTVDILREAGYEDDVIEMLLAEGVIGAQQQAPGGTCAA